MPYNNIQYPYSQGSKFIQVHVWKYESCNQKDQHYLTLVSVPGQAWKSIQFWGTSGDCPLLGQIWLWQRRDLQEPVGRFG